MSTYYYDEMVSAFTIYRAFTVDEDGHPKGQTAGFK